MDERDLTIQQLNRDASEWRRLAAEWQQEAEKWKRMAAAAAERACFECEEYTEGRRRCGECLMKKILDATKA